MIDSMVANFPATKYEFMIYNDVFQDHGRAQADELYEYLLNLRDALDTDDYLDVLEYVLGDYSIDLDDDLLVIADSIIEFDEEQEDA